MSAPFRKWGESASLKMQSSSAFFFEPFRKIFSYLLPSVFFLPSKNEALHCLPGLPKAFYSRPSSSTSPAILSSTPMPAGEASQRSALKAGTQAIASPSDHSSTTNSSRLAKR